MGRIAIIPNTKKEGTRVLAKELVECYPEECFVAEDATDEEIRAAIVLGGDGTMLRAVKRFSGVPLLGVNFGTLGYMAAVERENAVAAVKRVIDKDYTVEERMMLSVTVLRGAKVITRTEALNDGVISRKEHMLSMCEYFGSGLVYRFVGDGVIIATPTGSTAYSLSAGGPVAPPDMQMIISTPVCPHSIHIKPLIASAQTKVRVAVEDKEGNMGVLNVDGQNIAELMPGDEVVFEKSENSARLICFEKKNFYDILRYKLSGSKGE